MQPQQTQQQQVKPTEALLQITGHLYSSHGWQAFTGGVLFRKDVLGDWRVVDAAPILRRHVGLQPLSKSAATHWGNTGPQVLATIVENGWQHVWVIDSRPRPLLCQPVAMAPYSADVLPPWPGTCQGCTSWPYPSGPACRARAPYSSVLVGPVSYPLFGPAGRQATLARARALSLA